MSNDITAQSENTFTGVVFIESTPDAQKDLLICLCKNSILYFLELSIQSLGSNVTMKMVKVA
jgi:hypothetical protein